MEGVAELGNRVSKSGKFAKKNFKDQQKMEFTVFWKSREI